MTRTLYETIKGSIKGLVIYNSYNKIMTIYCNDENLSHNLNLLDSFQYLKEEYSNCHKITVKSQGLQDVSY